MKRKTFQQKKQKNSKRHEHPRHHGRPSKHQSTFRSPSGRLSTTHSPKGRRKSSANERLMVGRIRVAGNGTGYVNIQGTKGDIEIPHEFLNTALHGDEVEIRTLSRIAGGHTQGEVTRVLFREKTRFVGVLERRHGMIFLAPDDSRMYRDILIPEQKLAGAHLGEKVLVHMDEWVHEHSDPTGSVIQRIGKPGAHETEIRSIALERGFDGAFPPNVEKEAAALVPFSFNDESGRKDFRNILTFTIDPKDAKDFDDALSWRELGNGMIEVGVHIADVTHYLRPGSALEKEAAARATSVYLVDRTIPMLPERLSNDLCSIRPNEDRPTFSAVFTLSPDGTIASEWYGKAVIHSQKRLSYEDAQDIIEHPETGGMLARPIESLNMIAKNLRAKRVAQGAVEFVSREVKCELGPNGGVLNIYRKASLDAHKLIEEFMLLANRKVTEWVSKKIPEEARVFVYRIHDEPNAEKIADLQTFLRSIGQEIKVRGNTIHGQDINAMLSRIEQLGEKSFIHMATIRAMAKAVYSTKNIGHFGLGFEHYTHFTSPIRRYPDMMVHRLFERYLSGKTASPKELDQYERLSRYSSEMEIEAAEAERASIRYKQVEYWEKRVGEIWAGKISGVAPWGVFVEDEATGSEGMIHVNDLLHDYFIFEETRYRLVGQKTKQAFRLGDPIKARVRSVDTKKRLIGLSLVTEE